MERSSRQPSPSRVVIATVAALMTGLALLFLVYTAPTEPSDVDSPGKAPPAVARPPASGVPAESAVRLELGADFQGVVDAHPPGTTYVIAAGLHRLQRVVPKDGDVFEGEPGAILRGSRALDPEMFVRDGSRWLLSGESTEGRSYPGDPRDRMLPEHFAEERPEELFSRDGPLRKVDSLSAMTRPGTWYFDYAADRIFLFDDPRQLGTLELSVTDHAIIGSARDVVVRNLVVERYANPSQRGAIDGDEGLRWTVEYVEARDNHGVGLRVGSGGSIRHCRVVRNGQMGMIVNGQVDDGGEPVLVEFNEIAHNKRLGYDPSWEGGGTKFVRTSDSLFRHNWIHDNAGFGFWFDIDNRGATIESNRAEDNELANIFYEISKAATIRWNESHWSGVAASEESVPASRSALLVASSSNVEIYGNSLSATHGWALVLVNAAERFDDPTSKFGENAIVAIAVHDNVFGLDSGRLGVESDVDETFARGNVRFFDNTFHVRGDAPVLRWNGRSFHAVSDWADAAGASAPAVITTGRAVLPPDAVPFQPSWYGPR